MRLTDKELEKIKEAIGYDGKFWSYSRFDTYRTSPYEYFLKYVKKEVPHNEIISAYGTMGGIAHQCLEDFYNNKKTYKDLIEEYDNQFALQVDMIGLRFDKTDDEKNDAMRNRYYQNIKNFFLHFIPQKGVNVMEDFTTIKITDDIVFQGYIDMLNESNDGYFNIYDFKTSTIYKNQALIDHSHQLVLYAEGIRQRGIPEDKIRCYFNFLKYATYNFIQVNKEKKSQNIERINLTEVASKKAYSWMKKNKIPNYEEIFEKIKSNPYEINNIPELVNAGFSITDCYVEVENPFEIFKELKPEIIQTIGEIEKIKEEYNKTENERLWWDTEDNLKKESYYFANIMDYSIPQHKPYSEYLKKIEAEKEYANDLLGVMSNTDTEEDDWMKELFS